VWEALENVDSANSIRAEESKRHQSQSEAEDVEGVVLLILARETIQRSANNRCDDWRRHADELIFGLSTAGSLGDHVGHFVGSVARHNVGEACTDENRDQTEAQVFEFPSTSSVSWSRLP